MSAPLVVNTRDGVCWTRRAVTSGGIALYAPEAVRTCPEFVMATIDELAEQGIVGSAFALPMPEASNSKQPVMRARGRVEALVSGEVSEELEVRLDDLLAVACEPLRARVAELEAQRDALAARLKRGQEWQPGRTPALVSQDYLSQDELRSIFGIPLVAPWDDTEDPCHPCGCPTRFDRHAWGCPTLPAEDDVTGFFQPGHAYTHHPGPDTIGGPRLRFYCETVTTDRTTGQPVARGWGGRRYGDRWTSVQHTRGLEDWQSGQWADTTAGGDDR